MKSSIVFAIALFAFLQFKAQSELIDVRIKDGETSRLSSYRIDDEKVTVGELARLYMQDKSLPEQPEHLRVESHFGMTYKMDKTLKEAGIKSGTLVKIKYVSRAEDIGMKILTTLVPVI